MAEHPWERQEGEPSKAFAGFEGYRMLGPDRSLQAAWEKYCTRPGTLRERRQADREEARHYPGYWAAWARKWEWRERAAAWDEEVAALARDRELDRELQTRMAEQEEDRRQRQLLLEEARGARTAGRQLLRKLLQGIEAGELNDLTASDLLPHLQKISGLLEVGQRLERMFSGEPTDVTRLETDTREVVTKLLSILQDFVPAERLGDLARKLKDLEAAGA
jgi:hypothetical protein